MARSKAAAKPAVRKPSIAKKAGQKKKILVKKAAKVTPKNEKPALSKASKAKAPQVAKPKAVSIATKRLTQSTSQKQKTPAKKPLKLGNTPSKAQGKAAARSPPKKSPGKVQVNEPKPSSKPLFGPHTKDLYGYWFGKWYEVEVLKESDRFEKGQHVYLIRWTKDPNLAKPGEWATNESYYPEDWIFPKEEIPPHQLPGAAKPKSPSPPKRGPPSKAAKMVTHSAPIKTQAVPTPAFNGAPGAGFGIFKASTAQPKVHKYAYKWQYLDTSRPAKNAEGWHDYDVAGSDVVEEAYQSWVTNPYIDVRAVFSGHWNYMIDFNQMQQTNVDHSAHTMRNIRRVRVDDESDAMDEQRTIRRQVSLQRVSSQADQLSSSSTGTNNQPLQRVPSQRCTTVASSDGTVTAPLPQLEAGTLVRVPSGQSGIVLTNTGAPSLPVQVQFPSGETQFLDPKEVHPQ